MVKILEVELHRTRNRGEIKVLTVFCDEFITPKGMSVSQNIKPKNGELSMKAMDSWAGGPHSLRGRYTP